MALIDCPECKSPISEAALSCPGCGHPRALVRASDFAVKLRSANRFLWMLLQNIRMTMVLVIFLPTDAVLFSTYGPQRSESYSFLFWLTLLCGGSALLFFTLPRMRREQMGRDQPAQVGKILRSQALILLSLFLVLLPNADPKHTVSDAWELGFRLAGVVLFVVGIWGLYRYVRPRK